MTKEEKKEIQKMPANEVREWLYGLMDGICNAAVPLFIISVGMTGTKPPTMNTIENYGSNP